MDVNVVGVGVYDTAKQQVDPVHRAARVAIRPNEVGVFGSYRKALKSGVIAAGLTGPLPIWEFRWGQANIIALIRKLRVQATVDTTAFAATAADSSFSLFRAQGFTAIDSTNGTLAGWTKSKTAAVASRMANSQLGISTANGGIVILNTSASGLTGGTKTLDDDPLNILLGNILASAAAENYIISPSLGYLLDPAETTHSPIELNSNEGLVLQCDAITGTGTWRIAVEVEWDEVDPARYMG